MGAKRHLQRCRVKLAQHIVRTVVWAGARFQVPPNSAISRRQWAARKRCTLR
jgi:hypothetical protein